MHLVVKAMNNEHNSLQLSADFFLYFSGRDAEPMSLFMSATAETDSIPALRQQRLIESFEQYLLLSLDQQESRITIASSKCALPQ